MGVGGLCVEHKTLYILNDVLSVITPCCHNFSWLFYIINKCTYGKEA